MGEDRTNDELMPSDVASKHDEKELLRALFSELLEIDDVGMNDDFFDLGGESLMAMRLVARIEERTGTRLSLRDVFDWPSPAELASRLPANVERPA